METAQMNLVSLPEQACHCMPCGIVQGGVMLVLLSVGGVGVQGLFELWVALVQLVGQQLIPINQSLTELCGGVPHGCMPRCAPTILSVGTSHTRSMLGCFSWAELQDQKQKRTLARPKTMTPILRDSASSQVSHPKTYQP